MHGLLKISDAAAMALHAMTYLAAGEDGRSSVREIAGALHVSEAHLAKVLQRLTKVGLVAAVRGPGGGYALGKSGEEITLIDIVEAVDGPLGTPDCIMPVKTCSGAGCIFGGLLGTVGGKVRSYLSTTRLEELARLYA